MEKLNNKNFWTPLFLAGGISLILFLSILIPLFLKEGNIEGDIGVIILIIPLSVMASTIIFPAIFFIIKRLLSDNPKKVFYFELPILIIIYSVVLNLNQFLGMMMGGPRDMTLQLFFGLIFPQVIFVALWLVLLTLSLYFYYKKKIINRKQDGKIK